MSSQLKNGSEYNRYGGPAREAKVSSRAIGTVRAISAPAREIRYFTPARG